MTPTSARGPSYTLLLVTVMAPDISAAPDRWPRRPHALRLTQAALPAVDDDPEDEPADDPPEPDDPLSLPDALVDEAALSDFLAGLAPLSEDLSDDLSEDDSDLPLPTDSLLLPSLLLPLAAASRLSLR